MAKSYNNLADLLTNCENAKNYYKSLPTKAQVTITDEGSGIRTEEELKRFAKKIK